MKCGRCALEPGSAEPAS